MLGSGMLQTESVVVAGIFEAARPSPWLIWHWWQKLAQAFIS